MGNTPNIRFKGFDEDWEQRKLGDLVDRVTRKNQDLVSELPLTISAQYGLIDQNEFFDKRVASKDVSGYYLIENGEFAYNKSTSTDAPWGAIKRLDRYENGVLSTLYIVFGIKENTPVDSDFLVSYYSTNLWHKGIHEIAAEGARNHGLLNIAPADFFETKLMIPQDIEEQRKIGKYFEELERFITLHQRKCQETKKLKEYMLQKMFPKKGEKIPEIRFEGFTGDWEQRKVSEITSSYSGGTPKAGTTEYYDGDIPFIRSGEIYGDTTELFITEEGLNSSSAKMVHIGDILYALYGATSGEVSRAKLDGAINQAILAIIPNDEVNADFLVEWFRKEKAQITDKYLQGGQGNLSAQIIKDLKVTIPMREEQNKIGEYFSKVNHLITLHQCKVRELTELKNYMLQNMFPKKGGKKCQN